MIRGPGKGVVPNFQNALKHCRGEIIFIADQDDVWKEEKAAEVLKAFQDPEVMCVVHNAEIVDGSLKPSERLHFNGEKAEQDSGKI